MRDWIIVGLLAAKARKLAVRFFGEAEVKRIEDEPGWFS